MAGVGFEYRVGGVFRCPYAEPGSIRAGYGAGMFLAVDGIVRPEITPGSGGLAGGSGQCAGGLEMATAEHARGGRGAGWRLDRVVLAGAHGRFRQGGGE